MELAADPQVSFETEVQRQHPRIRVPATLRLDGDRRGASLRLLDLSAGGFAFEAGIGAVRPGQRNSGELRFNVKPLGLSLPVRFEVRYQDPESGRVGCRFDGLGVAEAAVLRQLIGACVGGDLVPVGDLLSTLSRDNLARPRRPCPSSSAGAAWPSGCAPCC
jgi:alginate biosynthesis protein Alg44